MCTKVITFPLSIMRVSWHPFNPPCHYALTIEANANKYTFVWKKSVTKNQARLLDRIALLVQECVKTYGLKEIWHGEVKEKHLGKILKKLYRIKDEEGIEFVHGVGHRKTQLQKHIELMEEYTARLQEYSKKLRISYY